VTIERKKTKNGTKYLARIYDRAKGKRTSLGTYLKRTDAEAAVERALEQRQSGSTLHNNLAKGSMPFEKFVKDVYLPSLNVSTSTKNDYTTSSKLLIKYFGDTPLNSIYPKDVHLFVASMHNKDDGEPYSENYRRKTAQRLRQVFATAVEYGYITATAHPYRSGTGGKNKLPSRPKESTRATLSYSAALEIIRILNEESKRISEDPHWAMKASFWYHLLSTALTTGMRRSELLGLRTSNLDIENCTIEITCQWGWNADSSNNATKWIAPKSKHGSRTIPLCESDFAILQAWAIKMDKAGSPDSLLFPRPSSRKLDAWDYWRSPSFFTRSYKKMLTRVHHIYKAKTGAKPWESMPLKEDQMIVRFHEWRHTFSVVLLTEALVDVNTVSKWLGHHSPAFTYEVYSRYIDTGREGAIKKIEDMRAKRTCQRALL